MKSHLLNSIILNWVSLGFQSSPNAANSLTGGDKIEEDQTLSAACLLVCEWANKLLGRVFSTLIELARFLVGGSYVSSKSMAAFVVMSSNDLNTPQIGHSLVSLITPLKQVEEQMLLTQKRRQPQQLPKKMPQRQQQKQIQQLPGNSMLQQGQALCNTPQQLLNHKTTLVSLINVKSLLTMSVCRQVDLWQRKRETSTITTNSYKQL